MWFFCSRWLPAKYREPQSDFFGKRGISWHISVVSRQKKQQVDGKGENEDEQEESDSEQVNEADPLDQTLFPDGEEAEEESDAKDLSETSTEVISIFSIRDLLSFCVPDATDFEHTVFVHVLDQCAQDSELAVAFLADTLTRLKANGPSIEQACIRSDNAGCYHSANTILSIPTISKFTGIDIRRMDFADPQGGKGN